MRVFFGGVLGLTCLALERFNAVTEQDQIEQSVGEFIVYRTDDERTEVQLRAVDGTVWLTQAQMAELYGTSIPNISQTISRIFSDGEVTQATINSELKVRAEGDRTVARPIKHYNLDMVLAVGYRVSSPRAVQFRQWATTVLREYLVKGFAMDDRRLKDPAGMDHFDELLERIRDIRASEKRFYQKVRDVFVETSADYDKSSQQAQMFFATIQNKLLFAVTGQTAAELVYTRADSTKPNMGLTTWKGSVVRKGDVTVSKNYLSDEEIVRLNRLATMFLDYAEDRASQRQQITMTEWISKTDAFLTFNEREVLKNAGKISNDRMKVVAGQEYDAFDGLRRAKALEEAERQHVDELESIVDQAGKTLGSSR